MELNNLNTAEIEAAIQKGYTPKIFIIDYQMSHVRDSEYRRALAGGFTGDNLRIIEENAKGRTALLKLIGPNMRQMHRVAVFSTRLNSGKTDICKPENIDTTSDANIKAGVSMRVALKRLKCSGIHVEFDHYVYDYTDTADEIIQEEVPDAQKRFYIYRYGIKSINGIENNIPCKKNPAGEEERLSVWGINPTFDPTSLPASNPASRETIQYKENVQACHVRLADLTEEELFGLSAWTIFANGKYHDDQKILTTREFTGGNCSKHCRVSVTKGLEAPVWVGDNYDIVYMSMFDVNREERDFGTHPFETGAVLSYNTSWSIDEVGYLDMADYMANKSQGYHNYSEIKSVQIGSAALGEQIEMVFKLERTRYLNPDFGVPKANQYKDFSYSPFVEERKRFTIEEAIDFELNLGVDTKWHHILRDVVAFGSTSPGDAEKFRKCEDGHTSWNLREQIFTVCVAVPPAYRGVGSDEATDIYLRPVLNNAYRNSVWPEEVSKINKFLGRLESDVDKYDTTLKVIPIAGRPASGNRLQIGEKRGDTYTILGFSLGTHGANKGIYTIRLSSGAREAHTAGTRVSVNAGLRRAPYGLEVDSGYENVWNRRNYGNPNPDVENDLMVYSYKSDHCASTGSSPNNYFASTTCLGYSPQRIITNWLGNRGFGNNWADSSLYASLGATEGMEMVLGARRAGGLQVGRFPIFTKIGAGGSQTCAILESGGLKCWSSSSSTPAYISGLTSGVTQVDAGLVYYVGSHTCALLSNGSVKCWGKNNYSQLGNGGRSDSSTPVNVSGLYSGVREISAGGGHTCALPSYGSVKCWGSDNYGQLGNGGSNTNSYSPVNVSGLASGVSAIAAGYHHTCAALSNGGVKCWGRNTYGQLGIGRSGSSRSTPVNVSGLVSGVRGINIRVRDIAAGRYHTCAALSNGFVRCWGYNYYGQLGNKTNVNQHNPVSSLDSGVREGVREIAAGWYHTCALLSSGGVKCWGRNNYGQLGDGTSTNDNSPVQVAGLTSGVSAIAAGSSHTCATLSNGGVKCWGHGFSRRLINGTITYTPVYVKFPIPKTHLFTSPLIERDYSVRARIKF